MDTATLTSALSSAQSAEKLLDTAAKLTATAASQNGSPDQPADLAAQNVDRLANVGAGVGTQLDISV